MIALEVAGDGGMLEFAPARLVVAGYTGRDAAAVQHHIDELAAIGIPPPPRVPMRYDMDPDLLTVADEVALPGAHTSGEAEPVLLRRDGRWYLGVGSDHTDRDLEREDIGRSKAACPKPVGPVVIPVELSDLDRAWDAVSIGSAVDGRTYQDGKLSALRTPGDLLAELADAVEGDDDLALFAGTVPLLDGMFRYGTEWTVRLQLERHTLTHTYRVR